MNRTAALTGTAALTLSTCLTFTAVAPSTEAATPADLITSKVTPSRTTVTQGAGLDVTHTVTNKGRTRAGTSDTRFYLSSDPADSLRQRAASRNHPRTSFTDVLLNGPRRVAALAPGRALAQPKTRVTVPIGTPAGTYALLACADDRGTVKESQEAGNCAIATKRITVTTVPGSETLRLDQLSDVFRWPDDESGPLQLVKVFCQSVHPPRALTLSASVAAVRADLTRRAGADAVRMVDTSPLAATADQAQELAAAAITQASPGLALAALLRAHTMEPRNSTHLVNAAALATGLGLPNEALAMLEAAARLDLGRPAMGVSQQAIALVVRANALVLTGRAPAARPLYTAAAAREPLLTEAQAGLATVEACAGDDEEAARWLRRSRQRHQERQPDTETPTGPHPAIGTSTGRVTPLRRLPLAQSPSQLVKMKPIYDQMHVDFVAFIAAKNVEDEALFQRMRAADQHRTRAETKRRDGILRLTHLAGDEPDIDALQDAFGDALDDLVDHGDAFFGEGTGEKSSTYGEILKAHGEPCHGIIDGQARNACYHYEVNRLCRPAMITAHQEWLSLMATAQTTGEAYQAAKSQRVSGYAAHLADPDAHRSVVLGIEDSEQTAYASLSTRARSWATHVNRVKNDCVEPKDAPTTPGPGAPPGATPGPCTAGLRAFDVVIPLGAATVKLNCEKVQVGVSAETIPLVAAFAEVTYDFRAGKVTFFGGAQGGGKVGDVVELAFKSGVYVTADKTGTVDAGWRVGPSAAVGTGSVESGVFNDEIDLSFVSALRGTD